MSFTKWMESTKLGQVVSVIIAGLAIFAVIGISYVVLGPGMSWLDHFYRDVLHLGALIEWFQNAWLR